MIKKLILFILLNSCITIYSDGQIRFNQRVVIDSFPKVVTSVYPTDSCYYGIGLVSDTINYLAFGNIFYKFDLEGNLLFEKRITNPSKTYEAWRQVKLNSQNELVSIGYTKDTSAINWKSWFVKFNFDGDTLVTKEHVSPNFNVLGDPFYSPLDFLETPDGGYLFIANTDADVEKDIAVTKLDIDGNEIWSKTYGNIFQDIVYNIIPDGDNYIICGRTNTNGLGSTSATFSMYLFSIDIDGNELWSYVAPASEEIEIASDIIEASDGGYFVAAYIETEIVGSSKYTVGSTAKLNENFEVEWHHPIYHESGSRLNELSKIVEEHVDTAFTAWGTQFGFSDSLAGIQPWMARVSVDGDSLWSRSYTFLGLASYLRHQFYDVRRTPDGGYIMCGESIDFSPDGSGDGTRGWLIKVDEYGCLVPGCHLDTSTDDPLTLTQTTVKVYPNPTSDYLNVYYKNKTGKAEGFFRLIDMQGRVLFSFAATQRDTTYMIDLEKYSSGIYFLQYLKDGRLSKTEKIIIQK